MDASSELTTNVNALFRKPVKGLYHRLLRHATGMCFPLQRVSTFFYGLQILQAAYQAQLNYTLTFKDALSRPWRVFLIRIFINVFLSTMLYKRRHRYVLLKVCTQNQQIVTHYPFRKLGSRYTWFTQIRSALFARPRNFQAHSECNWIPISNLLFIIELE